MIRLGHKFVSVTSCERHVHYIGVRACQILTFFPVSLLSRLDVIDILVS